MEFILNFVKDLRFFGKKLILTGVDTYSLESSKIVILRRNISQGIRFTKDRLWHAEFQGLRIKVSDDLHPTKEEFVSALKQLEEKVLNFIIELKKVNPSVCDEADIKDIIT